MGLSNMWSLYETRWGSLYKMSLRALVLWEHEKNSAWKNVQIGQIDGVLWYFKQVG